jgi:SPP1 gp7 family putative phage head morphogenesis protein
LADDKNAGLGIITPSEFGLTAAQIQESRARLDTFDSRIVSRSNGGVDREEILRGELPKGAVLSPRTSSTRRQANLPSGLNFQNPTNTTGQYNTGQYIQTQRPYQPEYDSPDRQSYPVHRILANRYWRLFHKLDPIIGTAIDIYSEMPWSKFQLGGDGVDGEIRKGFEAQVEETQLLSVLPYFSREYLVTGEAVPHCIFDETKGHWTHVSLHNPDQLEVIDAPFLHMNPIVEFVPDDRLRQIVNSSDPSLMEVKKSMPPELAARIQSGQNIPLDELNVTFMARKLHSYDTRGTSILSRLWRILMYEDAIFSASIATARRHASPVKVVKLGNERTGWIPGPQAEMKMADLLAKAELDPHAYIITHYGVAFEAWGTTDRTMNITRELDTIERMKLVGLGISKALVMGEVTYASAEKGLTVFQHRLKTMRNMVEAQWLIPKYFRAVSKINGWKKVEKSQIAHRYRIVSKDTDDSQYVVPTIEWENSLSPRVDVEMQKAIEALERLNIKISKTTKMATVAGLSYEKEQKKLKEEQDLEREIAQTDTKVLNAPESNSTGKVPSPMPPAGAAPTETPACLVVGSPITMAIRTDDGQGVLGSYEKPIEQIFVGDFILDSQGKARVVYAAWNEGTPLELIHIEMVGGRLIECTPNHRFPVKRDNEEVELEAERIEANDQLYDAKGLAWTPVNFVSRHANSEKVVYNLSVEETHEYLVHGIRTFNSHVKTPMPPAANPVSTEPAAPNGEEVQADAKIATPMPPVYSPEGKIACWEREEHVMPIVAYLEEDRADEVLASEFWGPMIGSRIVAGKLKDRDEKFDEIGDELAREGYLEAEIDALHTALVAEDVLKDPLKEALIAAPDDSGGLSDSDFDKMVSSKAVQAELKKKPESQTTSTTEFDPFLVGAAQAPQTKWSRSPDGAKNRQKWAAVFKHVMKHGAVLGPKLTDNTGRFPQNVDATPWESPINLESRNEWQKRLDSSRLPDLVKSRVKFLENVYGDRWTGGFDRLWESLERRLKTKMRLEPDSIRELLNQEIKNSISGIKNQEFFDAFADIYAEGKLTSYAPLKYDLVKRKRLESKTGRVASSKIAITVDSVGERQVLDALAEAALSKVTDTVSEGTKQRILEALTEQGSYSESVMDIANRVIRDEKAELEGRDDLSKKELQERVKELYESQLYNVQRIMRTEAINAYAVATLRGFKEQGIEKVRWNSHQDSRTCNICLGLNGVEFDVDYLLSLGSLPISMVTHPQCRCFLTPVIVFVTFEEYEKEYEKTHPTEFAPTETVVNRSEISELTDILRDLKTKLTELRGVPAEYEEPMIHATDTIENANPEYAAYMPSEIRVVPDIAETESFKKEMGDEAAAGMAGQVTNYTDEQGVAYVSGFASRDSSPSAPVIRTWASSIWDKDMKTRSKFEVLFDSAKERTSPESIRPATANKLIDIMEPLAVARRVTIGPLEALTLNKRFRDMDETKARALLAKHNIPASDIDHIVKWRTESVLWDMTSGGVIESDRPQNLNTFVSETAALDSEHYFIESMVAYYTMPLQLQDRDPDVYQLIRDQYFGSQETTDIKPGET